jgi:glutamate-ammonia-ligase adenylyltransferase
VDYPDLADWTDNIRILESLDRHQLLPGKAAADLTQAYKALRSAYHRGALQEQPKTVAENQLQDERERVRGLWRELFGD